MSGSQPTWPRHALKDLVDERGITYGVVQPGQPTTEGVPIVRVNNITPAGLRIDEVMRIDPAIAKRHARSCLAGGEVLITLVGSVGNVAVVPPELAGWNVARAVGVIPVRPGIPSRWLAWCLQAPEATRYLSARLNTTVQKTLNLRDLSELEIPLPSTATVGAITSVLGALDDKIDSNRRLSSLLSRTFSLWFEATFLEYIGRDDLIETSVGPIPPGWRCGTLADIARVHRSLLKGQSDLPYIGLDAMPKGSTVLTEWLTEDAPSGQAARFEEGDILFGKLRPYFKKVGVAPVSGRCSTEILVLRPKDPRFYGVVFGCVSSQKFIDHCVAISSGTRMPRAEWKDASSFSVAIPPAPLASDATSLARKVFEQIVSLTRESRNLQAARDNLLPHLISGRIRVPDTSGADELPSDVEEVPV